MSQQEEFGWVRSQTARHEYPLLFRLLTSLILISIGIAIGWVLFADDPGYSTNLYTELLSISVTVFVLNGLASQREEQRRVRDLKDQLIRNAASLSNEIAKDAVHQMRRQKWLRYDDKVHLLKGADLENTQLQDSDLSSAILRDTYLVRANLRNAQLIGAHLEGANLWNADLRNANLWGAFLQEARLEVARLADANLFDARLAQADLNGAYLERANLHGANLKGASLEGAKLEGAIFDRSTVLPDGNHWSPDTDLTRFTDPYHTNFWRAEGFMLRIILPQQPDS